MTEETKQYEIKMYKLLILVIVGVFAALGLGLFLGEKLGEAQAAGNVDVELPDYCTYNLKAGELTVRCNELEELSANEVCNMLSTPLKNKIHVVIAT